MKEIITAAVIASMSVGAIAENGRASYYADKFQGRPTASGEPFDQCSMTGAHKTLELGTWVLVTNLKNNQMVKVKINDRGPFVAGRIIDLSRLAANELGFVRDGHTEVTVEVVEE